MNRSLQIISESGALINIGELSKPATVLIEKISDAIGGIFLPYQIRRVAEAEAQAEKVRTVAQIEITELQRRAMYRFLLEEAKKQHNIETITKKALEDVRDDARPEEVEDGWITNFFDKCRLVSDEQMQQLWAKTLAGEANSPGQYSKRTVNLLASLDKADAQLVTSLGSFGWVLGNVIPLIYDVQAEIYNFAGITFNSLKHLDEIGLISFGSLAGYKRLGLPQKVVVFYYGEPISVEFQNPEKNDLNLGKVLLSKSGQELARICGSQPALGFKDYVIKKWREFGYKVEDPNAEQGA